MADAQPGHSGKRLHFAWLTFGRTLNGAPPSETLTLYRIIRTNVPSVADMRSYLELGIPLRRDTPEARRRASGISLFDSIERARLQAQGKPWVGKAFIAELLLPANQFQIEKTAGPGHYTAWGDAHDILDCVRHVERA